MSEDGEVLDLFSAVESEDPPAEGEGEDRIWTVSEVNAAVRVLLEGALSAVWVGGEVANWTRARSGHCYFTLKDDRAQLRCVLFRRDAQGLPLDPEDGMRVQAFGSLTLYEARGDFQLVVRRLRGEEGEGLWRLAFERLRKKLEAEGLLAAARKRRLPPFPRVVGVVTSPTGAAFRDVLTVIGRRAPWTRVLLRGARVQGEGAAEEIAEAIRILGESGRVDLLIVGRGGGSIEDLWAFNEEVVARAVAACSVPVISAVGHETDLTIADLVADLRAPTPSAAAEAAVRDGGELAAALRELRPRLARGLATLARERVQALESARSRLIRGGRDLTEPRSRAVSQQRDRLERGIVQRLSRARERLSVASGRLESLSPLGTLRRGYAVPRSPAGRVLRSAEQVGAEEWFDLVMADGRVRCEPKEVVEEGR